MKSKKSATFKSLALCAAMIATPASMLMTGCHAPVVAVIVIAGKLTAVKAGAAVLSLAAAYYSVEAAYYDKEANRLELEAVKNGEKTKLVIDNLTDDQIKTILEKGTLELEFEDGAKETVKVKMK